MGDAQRLSPDEQIRSAREAFDEGRIAITVAGIRDLKLLDADGQIFQRIGEHIAAGELVARYGAQLRPFNIGRPDFTPLRTH